MMASARNAIIVGAGLAGLTAAHRLSVAGWKTQVLESSDQIGGRARSVSRQGYLFDTGAVGIGTCYSAFMSLLDELGLADCIARSSTISGTFRDGRLHEIDSSHAIRGALRSRLFSWRSKLRLLNLVRDVYAVRHRVRLEDVSAAADLDDESASDYALRRLDRELHDCLIAPMIRALNLTRPERVSRLEIFNALLGLFDTQFIGLLGGIGVLPARLAEHTEVELGVTVSRVDQVGAGVRVRCRTAAGIVEERSADACVIATLLPQALQLHAPLERTLGPLAGLMTYNRGLCVHLGYAAPTISRALAAFMPICEQSDVALLWLEHNKAPDRAPPGHSLITVFHDDMAISDHLQRPDDVLVADCRSVVERRFPELAARLDMTHVTRWPLGLGNPAPGVYRRMQQARREIDPASPIQLAGDYFSAAGTNAAIVSGREAAANLLRGAVRSAQPSG